MKLLALVLSIVLAASTATRNQHPLPDQSTATRSSHSVESSALRAGVTIRAVSGAVWQLGGSFNARIRALPRVPPQDIALVTWSITSYRSNAAVQMSL